MLLVRYLNMIVLNLQNVYEMLTWRKQHGCKMIQGEKFSHCEKQVMLQGVARNTIL